MAGMWGNPTLQPAGFVACFWSVDFFGALGLGIVTHRGSEMRLVDYFTAGARCRARRELDLGIRRVRRRGRWRDLPVAELFSEPETFRCSRGGGQGKRCSWSKGCHNWL